MTTLRTLQQAGFSEAEVRRLQALKRRYYRGEFDGELDVAERRRREFARWLVRQGRLSG